MAESRRKPGEDALLLALACGASAEAAAKQCGVSDRTVYRRLKDPDFRARLKECRGDMVRRSAGMLTAAATEAVRTLLGLLKEASPANVRLGAARAVLEIGIKVREMAELEAEMRDMEDRIRGLEGDKAGGGRNGYVGNWEPPVPLVGGDADPNAI